MPSSFTKRCSVFYLFGDKTIIKARQSIPICWMFFLSSTLIKKHNSSISTVFKASYATTYASFPSLLWPWISKHHTINEITPSRTCQLACCKSLTMLLTKVYGLDTLIKFEKQLSVMSLIDCLLSLSFSMSSLISSTKCLFKFTIFSSRSCDTIFMAEILILKLMSGINL